MAIPGIFSTLVNAVTSQFLPQDNTDGENTSENPQNETGGTELSEETKAAVTAPETPEMPDPQKHPTAAQRWLNENTGAELDEDGQFGPASKAALEKYQKSIAPKEAPDAGERGQEEEDGTEDVDGTVDPEQADTPSQGAVTVSEGAEPVFDFSQPIDPANMNEAQIKALQKKIGAGADGKWGPGSRAKLNNYYVTEGITPPNAAKLDEAMREIGIEPKSYAEGGNRAGQGGQLYIDGKPIKYNSSELSSGGEVSPQLIESLKETMPSLKENIEGLRLIGGNDAYHLSDAYYDRRFSKYATNPKYAAKKKIIEKLIPGWDGKRKLTPEERTKLKDNKTLGWKSKHTDGRSADFAVTPPGTKFSTYRNSPEMKAKVQATIQNLKDQGFVEYKPGRFKKGNKIILNEYDYPSSGASGPHFHMGPNDGAH